MDYYFKTHKRLTEEEVINIFRNKVEELSEGIILIFTFKAIQILNTGGYLYLDFYHNRVKGYDNFSSLRQHNDTSLSNLKLITIKHNIKYNKELN